MPWQNSKSWNAPAPCRLIFPTLVTILDFLTSMHNLIASTGPTGNAMIQFVLACMGGEPTLITEGVQAHVYDGAYAYNESDVNIARYEIEPSSTDIYGDQHVYFKVAPLSLLLCSRSFAAGADTEKDISMAKGRSDDDQY